MATICDVRKIDSNATGLSVAEEICLGELPTLAADGFDPTWFALEPNSYSDFGGESSTTARSPINQSRQRQKGTITGFNATAGFNVDLTYKALVRLTQGFFFANAHEKPSNLPILLGAAQHPITSVATGDDSFNAATGLASFRAGHLVLASGFDVGDNNKLIRVTTVAAGKVTGDINLVNESTPPITAKIEAVGFQFAAGELSIVATSGAVQLVLAAAPTSTWIQLGLTVGEWVGIGGNAASTKFADNNESGFGRIWNISSDGLTLTLNDTTFVPFSSNGAAKTVQVYFGTFIRNEPLVENIKLHSFQLERTLGNDSSNTPQSQYIEGAVANELTINIPLEDKANVDLKFIAIDETSRTGLEGLKIGARIPSLSESAINTSDNVYRIKLGLYDPAEINQDALFGFVTEGTLTIANNASPVKALGSKRAIDVNVGNFDAGGSLTALFSTVEATRAVRNNADASFNVILAGANSGLVFDVPLLGLGGGRPNVQANSPITIPLTSNGAKNEKGYTMSSTWFSYLPNSLMPTD